MKGCFILSTQNTPDKESADIKKMGITMIVVVLAFFIGVTVWGKFKADNRELPAISGKHHAQIVVRDYGTITVELDADMAPTTVDNFLKLADEGFYDGLTFHRIYPYFMIQGGSPNGDGVGGSGTNIFGEFKSNGWDKNTISHVRGTISMARTKEPDSASSQFFIVHEDSTYLDGDYAAFGTVTEGMDVVDALCDWVASGAVICDNNGVIQNVEEMPIIETVKVID
ncbi:MAG: peptidylprolyl isomerase [Clostridia bacterium]|nr:peptidylprolyl isomerase [Clostridia bacterium]